MELSVDSLRLLGPRVLVKVDEEPDKFFGTSLVKPETVHESAEIEGTVVSVGTGYPIKKGPDAGKNRPIELSPGDRVGFIKFYGDTGENPRLQTLMGAGYIILKTHDILYVREDDDEGFSSEPQDFVGEARGSEEDS